MRHDASATNVTYKESLERQAKVEQQKLSTEIKREKRKEQKLSTAADVSKQRADKMRQQVERVLSFVMINYLKISQALKMYPKTMLSTFFNWI